MPTRKSVVVAKQLKQNVVTRSSVNEGGVASSKV
jgi:hypothetical protein